jgi:hypothetical protein
MRRGAWENRSLKRRFSLLPQVLLSSFKLFYHFSEGASTRRRYNQKATPEAINVNVDGCGTELVVVVACKDQRPLRVLIASVGNPAVKVPIQRFDVTPSVKSGTIRPRNVD